MDTLLSTEYIGGLHDLMYDQDASPFLQGTLTPCEGNGQAAMARSALCELLLHSSVSMKVRNSGVLCAFGCLFACLLWKSIWACWLWHAVRIWLILCDLFFQLGVSPPVWDAKAATLKLNCMRGGIAGTVCAELSFSAVT